MAGLLDLFGNADDAQRAGLLMLAAAGPRAQPASFGQRLLESVSAFDAQKQAQKDRAAQDEERRQRAAMQAMQMQQMQQAATDRAAQQQAAQEAAARRGGYLDSINQNAGPAQPFSPAAALLAGLRPEEMKVLGPQEQENPFGKIDPKDYTPDSVAQFSRTRDFTQLRKVDKPETKPEILRVLGEAFGEGSPQYAAALKQYVQKTTTHQPGVNVNVGDKPPAGYKWNAAGGLDAIPGGPADKLPEKQQSQVLGAQNLRNGIAEYREALQGFGTLDTVKPDARARMGTKYNNMLLQAKEAYNLGVLNGPDYEILQSVVTDPRTLQGVFTSKKALDDQARELDRIMSKIADTSSQRSPRGGQSPTGADGAPKTITSDADYSALPSGTVFVGPDGKTRRKP